MAGTRAPIYLDLNNKYDRLEVVTLLCCSPNLFPYLPLSILQSRSHYKFMKTETLGIEERGFGRIAQDIALHQNVSLSLSLQNICFVPTPAVFSPQRLYVALEFMNKV